MPRKSLIAAALSSTVLLMLASAASAVASDDTNTSQTTAKPAGANATPGASVDDLITNPNLRALSGSTSRWSIASQFNYNGGTIGSPLSQDRPNISASSGTTVKSDLDGSISAKFNINATNSLLAGFGVRWIAPTVSTVSNYDGTRFDAMNPYVTYQYVYKWLGVQSVMQVQMMEWTQADQTALGYARQLNIDQENMYAVPHTKLSIGASTWLQYQWFNKSGLDANGTDLATEQSQYEVVLAPTLEYQISDTFNFRTLVSLWNYEHYRSFSGNLSFVRDTVYESVGVGVSITRDIFVYPNVQFLPQKPQAALTNVGMTATVNLF